MLYQQVNKVKIDNEKVADITDEIQKGAMAFLVEYKVLAIFCIIGPEAYSSFPRLGDCNYCSILAGALTSVAAGFSGMRAAATSANGRTAMAAKSGRSIWSVGLFHTILAAGWVFQLEALDFWAFLSSPLG